jgi:lysophospholipase L1-like esterase
MAVLLWAGSSQAAQVRIMPLGDSITSSVDGQASYRYWLWRRLVSAKLQVDFVGTQWGVGDGTSGAVYGNFDQDHEGHPGYATDEVLAGVADWASQTHPQAVMLCIGANDFERGYTAAHALANTLRIIGTLRAINPRIAVLWAMLPPDPRLNAQIKAYNLGVLRYAPRISRLTSPVRIVNLSSGFYPARDTLDGVHPNYLGEQKIALRFYATLAPIARRLMAVKP